MLRKIIRGGSRTAATSKLSAVNYYHKMLHLGWCSSPNPRLRSFLLTNTPANATFIWKLLLMEMRFQIDQAVVRRCSVKKMFLEILHISLENISARVSLQSQACNFIKKESLAQLFSCEFCEISRNTFFNRTPPVDASENWFSCIIFISLLEYSDYLEHWSKRP